MQATKRDRLVVFQRDGFACAACGARDGLEFQHRQAVGMGGSRRRPSPVEGLVLCSRCNMLVEGPMQSIALACGWKVRKWVKDPALVPVFYPRRRRWFLLEGDVLVPVKVDRAEALMRRVYGAEFDSWKESI